MPCTAVGRSGRFALLALLALAGCTDTAVDEDFQGELIASVTIDVANAGTGRQLDVPLEPPEGLRVALFWHAGGLQGRMGDLIEHPSTGVEPTERRTVLTVREPPPSEALVDGAWAIARPVAYIDADGDDLKGPDEPIFSSLKRDVLLFALRDLDAASSPTGAPLAAGLHRQGVPVICDPAMLPQATTGNCGVPFERVCETEATECGPGVCYTNMPNGPMPVSACSLAIEDAGDCHPAEAGFRAVWDGDPDVLSGHYVERCAVDSDCTAGGRICNPLNRACYAPDPLRILLPGNHVLTPLCVEDDSPEAYALTRPPSRRPPPGGMMP